MPRLPGRGGWSTICNTLGLYREAWFPKTAGAGYETTEYLSLLEKHRQNFTLFTGFSHEDQSGRAAAQLGGHVPDRGPAPRPRRVPQHDFDGPGGGQPPRVHDRFPSVVLGTASPQSQSYTRSGAMVTAETSPENLFRQLFLQGTPEEVEREKLSLNDGGSILDRLKSQTASLRRRVSLADQTKLDAYYNRGADRRTGPRRGPGLAAEAEAGGQRAGAHRHSSRSDLIGRVKLMLRMIPLILETDSSRVISLMIQDHGVVIDVPGVNFDQHSLSHHGQDPSKIAQLKRIETGSSGASPTC